MKTKLTSLFIFCSIALISAFSSCDSGSSNAANEGPSYHAPAGQETAFEPMAPVDYKNGVYYFATTRRQFGISLSVFLADTTRHLISITADGTGMDGLNVGYWVVVKEK